MKPTEAQKEGIRVAAWVAFMLLLLAAMPGS